MSENELIKGCVNNDRSCQKLLFQRYSGRLLILAKMYARTRTEAEDFVQVTFIKAFGNLKSFQFKSTLETWLKRILINVALKELKKKRSKNELIGIDLKEPIPFENDFIERLSFNEIIEYISQLPDGFRAVFNLFVFEGYSHKEIAKALNITESTSRSQLTRGRKLLQQKITEANKITYP